MNPLNYPGTSAKRLFHRFLVEPAFIEKMPRVVVLLLLVAAAAGLELILHETTLTLIFFAILLTDWLLLLGLRHTGRSFGPIVPSLLGLALLRFLLALLLAGSSVRWLFWMLMAGISLLVWYSTWIEPQRLTVTERSLLVPDWPAGAPPRALASAHRLARRAPQPRDPPTQPGNRAITPRPDLLLRRPAQSFLQPRPGRHGRRPPDHRLLECAAGRLCCHRQPAGRSPGGGRRSPRPAA